MKFYIATSIANAAHHNALRDALVKRGHEITYDWTSHGASIWDEQNREKLGRQVAIKEVEGVIAADWVVVLLPGGFGTHVELGVALATDKPVLVVVSPGGSLNQPGREFPPSFYFHPNVRIIYGGVDETIIDIEMEASADAATSTAAAEEEG